MPSPFPGMNPYLEQPDVWRDFHQAFITAIRNALIPQIRPTHLLVEIDLLCGGQRMPVKALPSCAYVIMVSRSYDRPRVELWPLAVRDPLPLIPVPLRMSDQDATVEPGRLLQFDAAGYEDYIYGSNPQPALATEDAAWARGLVKDSLQS
ncbi:MAG: DUF4058 family protein [Gemmataceae bacterium]